MTSAAAATTTIVTTVPIHSTSTRTPTESAACAADGVLLLDGHRELGVSGVVEHSRLLSADQARPGDRVILSGTVGDHGMAVMSLREGLEFETVIESDTAPLHGLVASMLEGDPELRCLRDPTRGGLASTRNELALASGVGVEIEETRIPVRPAVHAACELLGLDPLYVANEGKLVAIVGERSADAVVDRMRRHPLGADAAVVGVVTEQHPKMVVMRTRIGGTRVVDLHPGEILPRIC